MRPAIRLLAVSFFLVFSCVPPAVAGDGPLLTVTGTGIPETTSVGSDVLLRIGVLAGAPVEYCWTASPTTAPLSTTRFGWEVADPYDENDPGWSIPATAFDGTELCSDERQFLQGVPNFVVRVTDTAGAVARVIVLMEVDQSVPGAAVAWGTVKARF